MDLALREAVQRAFDEDDSAKLRVARVLERVLAGLKIPAFLGGGAAAAVLGSGRAIKDLDYKMSEAFQAKWKVGSQRDDIVEAIVSGLEESDLEVANISQNAYVLRMEIAGVLDDPIEISLTSTGNYSDLGTESTEVELDDGKTLNVTLISRDDLLLDKLFAFAERGVNNTEKLATDFIDIYTALNANPYPYLSMKGFEQRWVAYRKKWRREDKDPYGSGYLQMAPEIGLQVAMRTTLLTQDENLRQAMGLRGLRVASQMVGKFASTVQKTAQADRLRLRDEILSGERGDVGNEAFQELSKPERSEILQRLAYLRKKKERLEKRGRTKTTEYISADSRLFDLWMKWGIDLDFV